MNLPIFDQVHLWKIDHCKVATPYPVLHALLNSEEKARAERFVFDQHRRAFVMNRAVLKLILASYYDHARDPLELVFVYNRYGKPTLPDTPELQFNISHSADKALIAVSCNQPVGVDCEAVDKLVSVEKIALSQFSAAEYAHLVALPTCKIAGVFFQYWTRREATMKAVGMGFSLDIKKLCFDQDTAFINDGCQLLIPQLANITVVVKDCQSFSGFRASVAREHYLGEVTYFSWNDL